MARHVIQLFTSRPMANYNQRKYWKLASRRYSSVSVAIGWRAVVQSLNTWRVVTVLSALGLAFMENRNADWYVPDPIYVFIVVCLIGVAWYFASELRIARQMANGTADTRVRSDWASRQRELKEFAQENALDEQQSSSTSWERERLAQLDRAKKIVAGDTSPSTHAMFENSHPGGERGVRDQTKAAKAYLNSLEDQT